MQNVRIKYDWKRIGLLTLAASWWGIACLLGVILSGCGAEPAWDPATFQPEKFSDYVHGIPRGEQAIDVGEPDVLELEEAGVALGTLSQAYRAKATPGYQLGVTSGASRLQCDRSTSSQSCSLLTNIGLSPRTVTYYIESADFGSAGNVYHDEIAKIVEEWDTAWGTGWTFTEVFDIEPWPTLYFEGGLTCPGNSGSASIAAFSCVNLETTGENLSEGPGVVGNYTTHKSGIVHIDMADINTRAGGNLLRILYMLRHSAGHGGLAVLGLGGRLDTGAADFVSRMAVDPNWSGSASSSGETCRATSYSAFGDGTFTLAPNPQCTQN
jgi:hypothetical protein